MSVLTEKEKLNTALLNELKLRALVAELANELKAMHSEYCKDCSGDCPTTALIRKAEATENKVPSEVKNSEFGCCNCLYQCVECKQGSKYSPRTTSTGKASCQSYVYYD